MNHPSQHRMRALLHRELLETIGTALSDAGGFALACALPLALTIGPLADLFLANEKHSPWLVVGALFTGATMFLVMASFATPMQTRAGSLVRRLIMLAGLAIVCGYIGLARHAPKPNTLSEMVQSIFVMGVFGMFLLAVVSYYILRAAEKVSSAGAHLMADRRT